MANSYNGDFDSRDKDFQDEESSDVENVAGFSKLENLIRASAKSEKSEEPIETRKFSIFRNGSEMVLDIRFKLLSYARYTSLKKSVTRTRKGVPDTDYDKYRMRVVTDLLVDPNFNKKSFLDELGVISSEQGLTKWFRAGEIIELSDLILEASGFDTGPFRDGLSDSEDES